MVVGHHGLDSVHVVNHVLEELKIEQGHVPIPNLWLEGNCARLSGGSQHLKKLTQGNVTHKSVHVCIIQENFQ